MISPRDEPLLWLANTQPGVFGYLTGVALALTILFWKGFCMLAFLSWIVFPLFFPLFIQLFYFTLTWGFGKEKTLFLQGLQLCAFCLLEPVKMKSWTPEARFSTLINKEVALLTTLNSIRICLLICVHFSQPLSRWPALPLLGCACLRINETPELWTFPKAPRGPSCEVRLLLLL